MVNRAVAKSNVTVRAAEARDELAWRRLWAGYLGFYGATVPPEVTDRTWRRILDSNGRMIGRMAELEGDLVGFAISVVHEGTWSVRPTCYLEDLFVTPPVRGAGVGQALLDDLVALAGDRGCSSLYWHTRVDNAPARKLYDRRVPADDFVRYRLAIEPTTAD